MKLQKQKRIFLLFQKKESIFAPKKKVHKYKKM